MTRLARTRWRVWLACLAAVLGLAAPGSGVAGHVHAGNWQEICTVGGARLVRVAEQGMPAGAVQAEDDCACCVAGSPALLPAQTPQLPFARGGRELFPRMALAQASRASAWTRARPRAPPFVLV